MRLAFILFGIFLTAACAAPSHVPDAWEYRVIAVHDYYGFASAEDWLAAFMRGELMDHLDKAKNRWGAEGWDVAPECDQLGEDRLLLRRSHSNPAPFEVRFVMRKEIEQASIDDVQKRIDALVRDGWTLEQGDALFLEFHRAR